MRTGVLRRVRDGAQIGVRVSCLEVVPGAIHQAHVHRRTRVLRQRFKQRAGGCHRRRDCAQRDDRLAGAYRLFCQRAVHAQHGDRKRCRQFVRDGPQRGTGQQHDVRGRRQRLKRSPCGAGDVVRHTAGLFRCFQQIGAHVMLPRGACGLAEYVLRGAVEDGDIALGSMQAGDSQGQSPFHSGKNGQA
ncbi:hypothetical protein G6F65_020777 [Rhizopus arrhizus]|nr:hypothetical protein G6F65_020777 [Rhizopus arrhizus]